MIKKTKIIDPEQFNKAEAYIVCLHGPAKADIDPVPSVNATCADCKRIVHCAVSAPTHLSKLCAKCVLTRMGNLTEAIHEMAITEETIRESLKVLKLPDTPETRARVQSIASDKYIQFLRDEAALIDAEGSAWD